MEVCVAIIVNDKCAVSFLMTNHSVSGLNIPVRRAAPGSRPPPWGPPVGKTHPQAPGASASSGSPSLSPAGPAQLAQTPTPKPGTIPTSAPGHRRCLAGAAGPAGAQNRRPWWPSQVWMH